MAQASRQQTMEKTVLFNVKITTDQRSYLHKAAAERGVSASDLIRTALRREGALPPQ
jgi:uncharacterized protein (DUF1778 family)